VESENAEIVMHNPLWAIAQKRDADGQLLKHGII
jgi:hypothetical protein